MLTTMLGDYWFWRREHLPSAVLVRLLAEWGASKGSARASIRRLADRGVLVRSREGRTTSYGLRFRTQEALVEHAHRLLSFGATSPSWDGHWTMVAFSIPEGSRNLRHSVRVALRNLGLRPLYDGLWVSPFGARSRPSRSCGTVRRHGHRDACRRGVGVAGRRIAAPGLRSAERRRAYEAFAARYEPMIERVRAGEFHPAEAFLARESLMSDWMVMRQLDPDLPSELLRKHGPGRTRARSSCRSTIRSGLSASAGSARS
jgi:phenylacetic acid degradation operon negative regulatory protein